MHKYLRAVGFSDPMSRRGLQAVINEILLAPSYRGYTSRDDDKLLAEFRAEFGSGIGVSVCGEFDEEDQFRFEYCYPFLYGSHQSSMESVTVERRIANESYTGVCDDLKVGVTLIFYLQNMIDYVKYASSHMLPVVGTGVSLSALSLEGTVMLPLLKTEHDRSVKKTSSTKRMRLINAAKNGDEQAMESLTLKDMDTYSVLQEQIKHQDIYSLVDTYFMPYGVECDLYSVMAEITAVKTTINRMTEEEIYILTLDCNDLIMDVAINVKDLYGEPQPGRRFKGVIWLQGSVQLP